MVFRRPLASILTLIILAAAAWAAWMVLDATRSYRALRAEAATVSERYARLAEETVPFWENADAGLAEASFIESVARRMSSDGVRARLEAVVEMQQHVRRAADAIAARPALASLSGANLLVQSAAKGGDMTPFLDAYNLRVMEWNLSLGSRKGQIGAWISGAGQEPFPLLSPDGRRETETIIQI